MAAPGGAETAALISSERFEAVARRLGTEPWSFSFFQAVRLLIRMQPNRAAVGGFVHPSHEVVRFATNPVTAFPASAIQDMRWSAGSAPVMVVNFMGLTGPSGILPLYYSELIRERLRQKDSTLLAFFDLFNHRMVSLFYRAWEKYRFTIPYERGERDRFTHHLLDFIGLGTLGLQDRQAVSDDSLLFYGGIFALHTRSSAALQNVLEDYFDIPVEVIQFVGAWHALDPADQCQFNDENTFSEQLGVGTVVGDEIWDQQSGVRLRLGPMPLARYMDFLPEGSGYQPLRAITRFFSGNEIDFEVQLVLRRDDVPGCELAGHDGEPSAPRLGWSTWVRTAPMGRDPGDTILRL